MYRILIPNKIHVSLHKFINSFLSTQISRFMSAGLEDEYLIVKEYKMRSKDFLHEIYYHIDLKLNSETIFGFSKDKHDSFTVRVFVGNFMFKIRYSEDTFNKVRTIQDIEFHKK